MKATPKLVLAAVALAIAWVGVTPVLCAADEKKGESKSDANGPRTDPEVLRRYDKNGNGKLDPDEEAAMKADREKAKTERKKK